MSLENDMHMRWIPFLFLALAVQVAAGPGHSDTADPAEPADDHGGILGEDMQANETWSHTFTEEAVFDYHCHPHPWMQAKITVIASDGREPMNHTINVVEPADFEEWTFDPEELTVMVGDTVTWFNDGEQMHKIGETTAEHAEHIAGAGSTVDTSGDGHDHEHDEGSSVNKAFLWITGGLGLGFIVAQWAKKQSP